MSDLWHELLPLNDHTLSLIKIWSWDRTGVFYYSYLEKTDFLKKTEEYIIFFKGGNSCLKLRSQWGFQEYTTVVIVLAVYAGNPFKLIFHPSRRKVILKVLFKISKFFTENYFNFFFFFLECRVNNDVSMSRKTYRYHFQIFLISLAGIKIY